MMKFIGVCVALMALFVTVQELGSGESLTCYTCRMGIAGRCMYSSTMTCSDSQPSCYWGELAFNISRFMTLQTQGCMASSLCNKTESGTLLTAGYTITRTCCTTDLCNGATSIQLPLTVALGAALMAVWNTCSL